MSTLLSEKLLKKGGRDVPLLEIRVVEDFLVKRNRCFDSLNDKLAKRAPHPGNRFLAIFPVRNQLCDEGIVVGNDRGAGLYG